MGRIVKLFSLLVLLLMVAVGVWIAMVGELDLSGWRPEVEAAIEEASGRKISIDGEIDLDLLPIPTLEAAGLKFTNAEWGSRPEMFTADHIALGVELVPLLFGDINIRSARLTGVDLLLETNAQGHANWEFGAGGKTDEASFTLFDRMRRLDATDLSVEWRVWGEQPHEVVLDGARLAGGRFTGFSIVAAGELDGNPIELEGNLSSLTDYIRGKGLSGKVSARTPKLQSVYEGRLGRFPTLEGMDLRIEAQGTRWPSFADLTGLPAGDTPEWDISFRATEQEGVLGITDLDFAATQSKIAGSLRLDRTGQSARVRDLDLRVNASGTSWPYLLKFIGFPQGDLPPWRAAFHLTGHQDRLELTDIDALLDESDIAGSGTVDLSGEKPRIEGKITAQLLDVSTPEQWWQGTLEHPSPIETGGKVFSDAPVQTDWMNAVELMLDISADKLKTEDLTVDQATSSVVLTDGRLEWDMEATVYGGRGKGRTVADASQSPLRYQSTIEITDADMRGVTEDWFGSALLDAKGSFRYDIAGSGNSAAEVMGSLSGTGTLVVGKGMARAGVAERAVRGLATMALTTLLHVQKVDDVKMNCMASEVKISDGIAEFEVLVLDTERATVIGGGTANLKDETWDVYFKPKPKVFSLSAAVPVHMKGPFHDPEVTAQKIGVLRKLAGAVSLFVFPPAAVAGLADFGAGNPCVDIAQGEQSE